MVVCTPATWALGIVHPRTSCRSIVGKDHSRHMKRYQELENALSRCKPLQTSHRNCMDQVDRAPDNGTLQRVAESFTFIILPTSASQCILETD
ncbi:uncharacterized protein B0T23DRAFT_404447 [Neurospora hispaniola]|uniref:Uncharacterized protein n=1 Tax=Neurospora hispaniola TaxID=588809 RepID=A0AAJ0MRD9_9PEZI|nr:hypothetical protein B0T23DRAFT_404447 [Neurospora hispaniola]